MSRYLKQVLTWSLLLFYLLVIFIISVSYNFKASFLNSYKLSKATSIFFFPQGWEFFTKSSKDYFYTFIAVNETDDSIESYPHVLYDFGRKKLIANNMYNKISPKILHSNWKVSNTYPTEDLILELPKVSGRKRVLLIKLKLNEYSYWLNNLSAQKQYFYLPVYLND